MRGRLRWSAPLGRPALEKTHSLLTEAVKMVKLLFIQKNNSGAVPNLQSEYLIASFGGQYTLRRKDAENNTYRGIGGDRAQYDGNRIWP